MRKEFQGIGNVNIAFGCDSYDTTFIKFLTLLFDISNKIFAIHSNLSNLIEIKPFSKKFVVVISALNTVILRNERYVNIILCNDIHMTSVCCRST